MSYTIKKKKILIAGPLPPPYMGPTLATEILLKSKLNGEFSLCHLDTSDHRSVSTLGKIDFWNVYLPLKQYVKLVWLLMKEKPDLVYIPISQTTLGYVKDSVFILISKVFGRRVICHLRGGNFNNWLDSASRFTVTYVKVVHSLVDGQIVLGQKLRHLFEGIIPNERIYVVPNGKDIEITHCQNSQRTSKILFLSNLHESKGVLDVLNCVRLVIAKYRNVEFQFVGDWPDRLTKSKIDELMNANPEMPVRLLGILYGDDKEKILSQADVFVFPTHGPEGHPWVLIEAMANGLPVITTDQGSITESVIHGKNGFIVEKKNPKMIADHVLTLLNDGELRRRMGRASRMLYLEKFTEKVMVRNLRAALASTLG